VISFPQVDRSINLEPICSVDLPRSSKRTSQRFWRSYVTTVPTVVRHCGPRPAVPVILNQPSTATPVANDPHYTNAIRCPASSLNSMVTYMLNSVPRFWWNGGQRFAGLCSSWIKSDYLSQRSRKSSRPTRVGVPACSAVATCGWCTMLSRMLIG